MTSTPADNIAMEPKVEVIGEFKTTGKKPLGGKVVPEDQKSQGAAAEKEAARLLVALPVCWSPAWSPS